MNLVLKLYKTTDHIGSINLIVDASNGNVVDDLSYDACSVKLGFCEHSETKAIVELIPSNEVNREGSNRNPIDWTYSNFTFSSITDRGYTSHEQLSNFGLINMNVPIKREQSQACLNYAEREAHRGEASTYGRVYDPMTLGFLSPDPFVQNPSNSQNYNRFSYVLNNPLKYTDPSGYNYSYYMDGLPISSRYFRSKMKGFALEFENNIDRIDFVRDPMDKTSSNYSFNIGLLDKYFTRKNGKYGTWVEYNAPLTLSWSERKTLYKLYGTNGNDYVDKMINLYDNNVQCISKFQTISDVYWNVANNSYHLSQWEKYELKWDLRLIGQSVPDLISIDINASSIPFVGSGMTYSINLLTRGRDKGIHFTRTEQRRYGAEIDWGVNLNIGFFAGNPLNINASTLVGPVKSASGGWIYGGNGLKSYDSKGKLLWGTVGTGIGLTYGFSYGTGYTYKGWF